MVHLLGLLERVGYDLHLGVVYIVQLRQAQIFCHSLFNVLWSKQLSLMQMIHGSFAHLWWKVLMSLLLLAEVGLDLLIIFVLLGPCKNLLLIVIAIVKFLFIIFISKRWHVRLLLDTIIRVRILISTRRLLKKLVRLRRNRILTRSNLRPQVLVPKVTMTLINLCVSLAAATDAGPVRNFWLRVL